MDLALSFPPTGRSHTLREMLEYNTRDEDMNGENLYHCDHCNIKTHAKRCSKITHTASNLIITLNRFQSAQTKILDPVELPDAIQINQKIYYLLAVVVHSGASLNYGHYFTLSRFFLFNDSNITSYPNIQSAMRQLSQQQTPYILIYKSEYKYAVPKVNTPIVRQIIENDSQ